MRLKLICWVGLVSTAWLAVGYAAPEKIQPGEIWPDDRGQHVQAHGGGITKVGDVYYWFGEDRTKDLPKEERRLSCYASSDLAHWTFHNDVVKLTDLDNLGPHWVLERPKVYFNAPTKKFVLYAHLDDGHYKYARVAVFTCDTVDGNYQYLKSFRPLDKESRDIGQFIDDDGAAYLIFESRPERGFYIARLSADYLTVEKAMAFLPAMLEGGALVHYQGLYYVLGSALTGWHPNPNKFATAEHLEGPWSAFRDIAPPVVNTYGSQSSFLLKIVGTKTTSVVFAGDIWKSDALWDSRYLWMPVVIDGPNLSLPPPKPWTLDVQTGEALTSSL